MPEKKKGLALNKKGLPPVDRYGGKICGANKKHDRGVCLQYAGFGTDHPGTGRCKFHGGATPIRSGRYSKVHRSTLQALADQFESDPDPLNLLPELAQARALYADYLDRCKELPVLFSPGAAAELLAEISKAAKRIEDIRAQNAISRKDFYRIMLEMGRCVDLVVEDPEQRERIHDLWGGIQLA